MGRWHGGRHAGEELQPPVVEGGQHEGAREERQRGLLLPEERHPGLLGRGGQVRRAGRRLREEGCPGGRRVHGVVEALTASNEGRKIELLSDKDGEISEYFGAELKLPIFGTKLG